MSSLFQNGLAYQLLDVPHNWDFKPSWTLEWQRGLVQALRGDEDRADFRRVPRATLEWTVSLADSEDWAVWEQRLELALFSGRAAVPLWTRPSALLTNDGGTTFSVNPAGLVWRGPLGTGFYSFRVWANGIVRDVVSYDVTTGTLVLDGALPDATEIFPLLFGRVEVEGDKSQTQSVGDMELRLLVPQWRIQAAFYDWQLTINGVTDFLPVTDSLENLEAAEAEWILSEN